MFHFLQGIVCLFKRQFHGVILHFLTETLPSIKVYIYVYICMKGFPYENLNNAILCHKDCSVSWRLLSQRNATHFRQEYCVYMYNIWHMQYIISYSELCYFKLMFFFPNEWCFFFKEIVHNNLIFHEVIKYFLKGMPHPWKK